ncbi:MAG: hypothetical protein QM753_16715 [Thermomicrobiales bacterium]
MLPMNVDLIDTLIFERQYDIQRRMHRFTIVTDEPRSLWMRVQTAIERLVSPGPARRPDVASSDVIPVTTDRPAALVSIHAPGSIEEEALDRAA